MIEAKNLTFSYKNDDGTFEEYKVINPDDAFVIGPITVDLI